MGQQTVSIREAKAHLSELAESAARGNQILIVKHGKPTACLLPVQRARKAVDLEQLQALTRDAPRQPESAGSALRRLRDAARY